ncbi:uroporphyrinogen-III C-methyltransferase [Sinimarinibacterium sp. NLF-5-8]|uniref:uroporphyrinogen-III C-methyltransferase n=1 Tax=Sinimarinibacterium sp. NLF-5-8 TaxID=2698684 RepID=UPI00137B998B|nr:uroporphyrinogen-III C-methyltransferase [Sinimarinibacterium sp. NLF-5-8]QHS10353.1 hypothetical protein GT972_09540 [Sinimarinibacterium sp. NLF-5-8]
MSDQDQNNRPETPAAAEDAARAHGSAGAAEPPKTPPPPPAAVTQPQPPVPPPARGSGLVASLVMAVLVLALVAAAGWWGWQQVDAQLGAQQMALAQLQSRVGEIDTRLGKTQSLSSEQVVVGQRNANELARMSDRLDAQDQAIGALREAYDGGRTRAQLVVIEQLLMLASERLQIAREVPAAMAALEAADARLAVLGDPRLFAVREAIGRERAALHAVPRVDDTGPALALSSIIERVPRLPLKAQAPSQFEADSRAVTVDPALTPTQRAWNTIKQMLASSFTIRREQGPPTQLLSDAQTDLIRQVLSLKLEGARVALLRRDAALFREQARAASQWLAQYFNLQDAGISAVNAELSRLQGLQLQPALPDISQSLVLLRAHLEGAAQ